MDCLFNAFMSHAAKVGVHVNHVDARRIFYTMRSSILPEYTTWPLNKTTPSGLLLGDGLLSIENEQDPWWAEWLETNKHLLPEEIDDLMSDANGYVGGVPYGDIFDAGGYEIYDSLEDDFEEKIILPSRKENNAIATIELPHGISVVIHGNGSEEQESAPSQSEYEEPYDGKWGGFGANRKNKKKNKWNSNKGNRWSGYGYGTQGMFSNVRAQFTPASVAPWIINALAKLYGLDVAIESSPWWTPQTYLQEARTDAEKRIILQTDYGKEVEEFSFEPAIYCMVSSKHAQYGSTKPSTGVCCMAIQLSLSKKVYTT